MTGVAAAAKVEDVLGDELTRAALGALLPAGSLLLIEAELLANRQDHNNNRLAVILAHAACDVQTERAIADLCVLRGLQYLYEALADNLGAQVSLHVEKVRKIYIALANDRPTKQGWWADWQKSVKRRHKVAHTGGLLMHEDVVATIGCCKNYVEHLQKVVQLAQSAAASTTPI